MHCVQLTDQLYLHYTAKSLAFQTLLRRYLQSQSLLVRTVLLLAHL